MTVLFADTFRLPFGENVIGNRFGVHDIENGHDLYGEHGHRGVDFVVTAGTPIPVIANGIVERVFWSNALGNVTVVRHYLHGDNNDVYSGYAHQSVQLVRAGSTVKVGQPIGQVGETGSAADGAHLHLTLSRGELGVIDGPVVDPIAYIDEMIRLRKVATQPAFTTARPGEGLWAIAQRSGTSLARLEKLNPNITAPHFLVLIGQRIRVR